VCAPDSFIEHDWLAPDEQMNLQRAFVGLRYGLDLAVQEKGPSDVLDQCRRLVEESQAAYLAGDNMTGRRKLEATSQRLAKIPTR